MKISDLKQPIMNNDVMIDEASLADMRAWFNGEYYKSVTGGKKPKADTTTADMRDYFSKVDKPGAKTVPNPIFKDMPADVQMILRQVNHGRSITRSQFDRLQKYRIYKENADLSGE
jgi:hypothetical protein